MSNDDWYTPPDLAVEFGGILGGIDLDPCSNAEANRYVQAKCFYSLPEDGLELPWFGNVYCNPPYSRPGPWVVKAVESGRPTVMLTNNATETAWGQLLLNHAAMVWFPGRRISFLPPGGSGARTGNRYAQMISLLYPTPEQAKAFSFLGDTQWGGIVMKGAWK